MHQLGVESISNNKADNFNETNVVGLILCVLILQDPYVLYTVNAVYAAALGVDAALRKLCGDSYNGVCSNYRVSSTRSEPTLEGIKAARYVGYTVMSDCFVLLRHHIQLFVLLCHHVRLFVYLYLLSHLLSDL